MISLDDLWCAGAQRIESKSQFNRGRLLKRKRRIQFIISLDESNLVTDTTRLPLVGSTTGFTAEDLVDVLQRVSLCEIKDEAKLATTILSNTHDKYGLKPLERFVSVLAIAFDQCSDRVQHLKSNAIRSVKLEREFLMLPDQSNSELFIEWNQLVSGTCRYLLWKRRNLYC